MFMSPPHKVSYKTTPKLQKLPCAFVCFISQYTVSFLGEGNGNLLQYSLLGNPMDQGAWWDTVYGAAKPPLSLF